jgi:hypothetical protein
VAELRNQLAHANSAGLKGESTDGELPSVRNLPIIGIKYLNLYREVKVRETVYRILVQEYELARIRENFKANTVTILDAPVMATKANFPQLEMRIIILTFLAFCIAAWKALRAEWWENSPNAKRWKLLLAPLLSAVKGVANRTPLRWILRNKLA